jgi:hypothetical protein
MPVVINEFEVVEQAPLQRAPANDAPPAEGEAAQRIEPADLWQALWALEMRAARAWAH